MVVGSKQVDPGQRAGLVTCWDSGRTDRGESKKQRVKIVRELPYTDFGSEPNSFRSGKLTFNSGYALGVHPYRFTTRPRITSTVLLRCSTSCVPTIRHSVVSLLGRRGR